MVAAADRSRSRQDRWHRPCASTHSGIAQNAVTDLGGRRPRHHRSAQWRHGISAGISRRTRQAVAARTSRRPPAREHFQLAHSRQASGPFHLGCKPSNARGAAIRNQRPSHRNGRKRG